MKYRIIGEPLSAVVCDVDPNETLITEKGSMCWMSENMKMETTAGGMGSAFGRMFSGEDIFQNKYTAMGGPGQIAFASSFPGSIRAFSVKPGSEIIVQKSGFLASQDSVKLSVYFQKKFGAGFFGGEGFIMQKLSGDGIAFVEIDGYACEYTLAAGQSMIISTGHLAVMSASCTIDIVAVKGFKNAIFGSEGLYNTVVKGPGKILLQTMPISTVASSLGPFLSDKS